MTEKIRMRKEVGIFSAVSLIAGVIIGSGIFVSPKEVMEKTGSPGLSLLVWGLCGVLALIGALCYAELGTMIPRSGGDYEYIRESLGNLPAFLYLWSAIVTIMPAGNAVIAITFAEYIIPRFNCRPTTMKWVTRVQGFFAITKFAALGLIIAMGFWYMLQHGTHNLENPFRDTKVDIEAISVSFFSGFFSYAGWNYLNFLTEEIKNPNRNLPLAIYISLPAVTIFYLLVNVAYFTVLPVDEILGSDAVAISFSQKVLGPIAFLMPVLVACSCFGSVNGTLLSSSRLFFIGARYGHLPDLLALVNVNHLTPVPAVLVNGILSIVMLAPKSVGDLLNYASYVEAASQTLCIFGLLYLRWKQPNARRPIKVPLILPIVFLVTLVLLLILPIRRNLAVFGVAIGIVAAGVPVYALMLLLKHFKQHPTLQNAITQATVFTQKLTASLPEDESQEMVKELDF